MIFPSALGLCWVWGWGAGLAPSKYAPVLYLAFYHLALLHFWTSQFTHRYL